MEDLDMLLEDLGRGKLSTPAATSQPSTTPTSTMKKPAAKPVSSKVDLNELEDLMQDLAAPAKPAPIKAAATPVELKPAPKTAQSSIPMTVPTVTSQPAEKPRQSTTANVDDLEALMESLNMVANKRNTVTHVQPQKPAAPEPKPEPVYEAPKPQPPAPQPVYTPPAVTQPVYTPPPVTQPVYTSPAVTQPVYQPPAPQPTTTTAPKGSSGPLRGDELDKLLGNLTNQMSTMDVVNPHSKGICASCKSSIMGEIIQALGKSYHPEHFLCVQCRCAVGTSNFYEQNGAPLCENCYQINFCPKCGHCDQAIKDRCITALGKKWHPEHFICAKCLKPFPDGSFFERDGHPYCEADFYGAFAPKCGGCGEPIKGDCINALGTQWHPEHFVCTYCSKAFSGTFFEHNGKPYCEAHYHSQSGSLCSGCGKSIQGRCVNALDKKWHPEHFVCAFCMNPLAGGSYSEKNNKAYCKECFGKLFGN